MTTLITGNAGFIGTELSKRFRDVIGLDIKNDQDILTCELPDADLIIHLAGIGGVRESLADPKKYWDNNVEGTKRILECYHDKRVLVASSSSAYEPHLNPYAASKNIIEHIPHNNVAFMRFHTVYSETPRANMFFDKLLNGTLEYVTDHQRDFIHVEDLCDGIMLVRNNKYKGVIDIGTGTSVSVKDIAPHLPVREGMKGERKVTCADISLLYSWGFKPRWTVKEFLK